MSTSSQRGLGGPSAGQRRPLGFIHANTVPRPSSMDDAPVPSTSANNAKKSRRAARAATVPKAKPPAASAVVSTKTYAAAASTTAATTDATTSAESDAAEKTAESIFRRLEPDTDSESGAAAASAASAAEDEIFNDEMEDMLTLQMANPVRSESDDEFDFDAPATGENGGECSSSDDNDDNVADASSSHGATKDAAGESLSTSDRLSEEDAAGFRLPPSANHP